MNTTTRTLADFIASAGVTMTAERTDSNPHMADSDNMDHWKCVIKAGRSRMTTYFSMGYGHKGVAPTLANVLSCLADDASSTQGSFEDWCSELGFDADSRKAERTYKAVERNAEKLRTLLGDSAYETLLYGTDRD